MAVFLPKYVVSCAFLLVAAIGGVKSDNSSDLEIENTLRTLLSSQSNSMQMQALRRDILRKFQEALERVEEEDERSYKRSLSSLAAWNNLPEHKRNLEALARAGYLKTLPDEEDGDANYKRSIANLAKNGQLPMPNDEQKRGIESLARNGDLHPKKDIQELIDELYDKRNIGSLARGYTFPNYGKRSISSLARAGELNYPRFQFKRNIASLARDGKFTGKRNVAALLRQDDYLNGLHKQSPESSDGLEEKRSLQSIKAQYKPRSKRSTEDVTRRDKRDADYYYDNTEYPSPVYQNQNIYDYEDLIQDLSDAYPNAEKRFLGSVARTGWFRPSNSRYFRYVSPEKRHIGSLARLGWLPSFRNVRRFNRSGRSTSSDDTCREVASDGQAKDNANSQETPLSLGGKRYLLQPAVDNILLRKIFMHPRSH